VSNIFAEDAEVLLFGLTKGDRLRCGVNVRGTASTMVAVGQLLLKYSERLGLRVWWVDCGWQDCSQFQWG
jgi:hypothetical protein